ncbi:hypothetical protein [Halomonas faecis]|uniref:hypothetical protein n=1 Tax=Halomonas faecis TaxID=1562110 RepID=UPI0013D20594|nr:hypothetical protein [Halomonas faecis]
MGGIKAEGNSTIIATGAKITGNKGYGASADSGSFIDVDGADLRGNTEGAIHSKESMVTARDANISDNGEPESPKPNTGLHPWYQRPVGMIGIGLFITIVGGVVVALLTGVL